jgi:hypothetical protein
MPNLDCWGVFPVKPDTWSHVDIGPARLRFIRLIDEFRFAVKREGGGI